MSEGQSNPLRPVFNGSIHIEARPERLSGDGGAILLRDLDERLGWTRTLAQILSDPRNSGLVVHPLEELLRTRLYLMALGWDAQDDADHLRDDGVLRLSVSERRGDRPLRSLEELGEANLPDGLPSQPTMSRLIGILAEETNLRRLREFLLPSIGSAIRCERKGRRFQHATLDVDSFHVEAHGHQAGAVYNGYFGVRAYHPLVGTLAETGDILDIKLRPGNVNTAAGLKEFMIPILDRMEEDVCVVASVRGDAGMPSEEVMSALEERGTAYVFRIAANQVLDRIAEPLLKRPVGRRPYTERVFCHELVYQAASWGDERRVVLVVVDRPGEIFVDHFYLVTNWTDKQMSGEELLNFYRQRGTMEGHIAEIKSTMQVALSSTTRPKSTYGGTKPRNRRNRLSDDEVFARNEATLLLYVLSYNLANRLRLMAEVALPQDRGPAASTRRGGWSLERLRQKVLRVPVRLVLTARQVVMVVSLAASHLWSRIAPKLDRLAECPIRLE